MKPTRTSKSQQEKSYKGKIRQRKERKKVKKKLAKQWGQIDDYLHLRK
jgi:hypothetical protein